MCVVLCDAVWCECIWRVAYVTSHIVSATMYVPHYLSLFPPLPPLSSLSLSPPLSHSPLRVSSYYPAYMKDFIETCRQRNKLMGIFQQEGRNRLHLLQTTEVFSMCDLVEVASGSLGSFLTDAVEKVRMYESRCTVYHGSEVLSMYVYTL